MTEAPTNPEEVEQEADAASPPLESTDPPPPEPTDPPPPASQSPAGLARRVGTSVITWVEAAVLGGIVVTAVEILGIRTLGVHDPNLPGGLAGVATTVAATVGTVALGMGVAIGLTSVLMGLLGGPLSLARRMLDWAQESAPEKATRRSLAVLLVPAFVGLGMVFSTTLVARSGAPFATPVYNAFMHTVFAGAGYAIAGAIGFRVWRLAAGILRPTFEKSPKWLWPVRTAARSLAVAGAGVLVALTVGSITLLNRGLDPTLVLLEASSLLLVLSILPMGVLAAHARGRLPLIRPALALAFLVTMGAGYSWGSTTQSGLVVISKSGGLSATGGRLIRKLSDFDKDGYSAWLGGGDCAPNDANINPSAREIVDNGIDENCANGDLSTGDIQAQVDPTFIDGAAGLCKDGCDFIMITVDSLRWDRVGAYADSDLTPRLDALAESGTVFDAAYCLGPGTILTLPQLFSGVHDTQLKLDPSKRKQLGPRPLAPSNPLFPQKLAEVGYQTAAVVGHFYLESVRYGFETYDNPRNKWANNRQITSPDITRRAIAMLESLQDKDKPFFLWVHYYDPHHDYMVHPGGPPKSASAIERYDYEVKATDASMGEFIDHVNASGNKRPVVWVVTADHGEGLGEHGIRFHNNNFYTELCRAPLVISVPETKQRLIRGPVSLHDIGPTLMNLAGAKPEPLFEGRSLVDSIATGAEDRERAVFHQAVYTQGGVKHEHFGVSTDTYRLFWDRLNSTRELYHIADDPKELANLIEHEVEETDRLMKVIEGWLYRVEQ